MSIDEIIAGIMGAIASALIWSCGWVAGRVSGRRQVMRWINEARAVRARLEETND